MERLIAEQDRKDVVVNTVPYRLVSALTLFLDQLRIRHLAGPSAVDMAQGSTGQFHIFRFPDTNASTIQKALDRFVQMHRG